MTAPASLHLLTPGSPAYTLAKLGAVGGLIALRVAMGKRERARTDSASEHEAPRPSAEGRRAPHPVSRRKQRRRGRR